MIVQYYCLVFDLFRIFILSPLRIAGGFTRGVWGGGGGGGGCFLQRSCQIFVALDFFFKGAPGIFIQSATTTTRGFGFLPSLGGGGGGGGVDKEWDDPNSLPVYWLSYQYSKTHLLVY